MVISLGKLFIYNSQHFFVRVIEIRLLLNGKFIHSIKIQFGDIKSKIDVYDTGIASHDGEESFQISFVPETSFEIKLTEQEELPLLLLNITIPPLMDDEEDDADILIDSETLQCKISLVTDHVPLNNTKALQLFLLSN